MAQRAAGTLPQAPSTPKQALGWRIYVVVGTICLAAAIQGYDNAFIGGAIKLPGFRKRFGLNKHTEAHLSAMIMSVLAGGAMAGNLFAYPLADRFGRKKGLFISGAISAAGGIVQIVSSGHVGLLYTGRVISGVGIGIAQTVAPTFLSEVVPPTHRGRLVGFNDVAIMLAQLLGFWINYGVDLHIAPTDLQWHISFGVQLVFSGLLAILLPFLIESPRWLVSKRRPEDARKALSWARHLPQNHEYVEWEMDEIEEEIACACPIMGTWKRKVATVWGELNTPSIRRRLILAGWTKVMHSMSGATALTLFSPDMFKAIGFGEEEFLLTGFYGLVKICVGGIWLFFFIDTWGRRKTVISGSSICALAMLYMGTYAQVSGSLAHPVEKDAAAYSALITLYIFSAAFAMSWAVFPGIFAAEVFPTRLRALNVTLVNLVLWIMHFALAYALPYMLKGIQAGTFFLFGGFTVLSTLVVFLFYPETKSFSLERMDLIFEGPVWSARNARKRAEEMLAREKSEAGSGASSSIEVKVRRDEDSL